MHVQIPANVLTALHRSFACSYDPASRVTTFFTLAHAFLSQKRSAVPYRAGDRKLTDIHVIIVPVYAVVQIDSRLIKWAVALHVMMVRSGCCSSGGRFTSCRQLFRLEPFSFTL